MDKLAKSTFRFDGYKVKSIRFDLNNNFKFQEPVEIDFGLEVEVVVLDESPSKGTVALDLVVFDNAIGNNYPFSLSVSLEGLFSSIENVAYDEFFQMCEINGTATLFPFLRSIVADITRSANAHPLVLPLINVYQLIEERKKQDGSYQL